MKSAVHDYKTEGYYDELFLNDNTPRPEAEFLIRQVERIGVEELRKRQEAADRLLLELGITFTVYGNEQGTERVWPFEVIPRIVTAQEWRTVEAGLKQRVLALNAFLDDIYHEQRILKDGVVPKALILGSSGFREQCVGLHPPQNIWCHITGSDLVRGADGRFYVLEDNLRCPSGASYVLANRDVLKRTFPQIFETSKVRPVENYPSQLLTMLRGLARDIAANPKVVLLTPGIYNSAYFEHTFLARQMGVELVEGRDLVVDGGYVCMRTTKGLQRVDVIYRRVDDDYLDPLVFNPESMIGVPGIFDVYREGRVAVVNGLGTGVADDKAVYAYVPKVIRYYLDQEPILENISTYLCGDPKDRSYVLEHLEDLVVKPVNASGGYGIVIGARTTRKEREACAERIRARPQDFIAQPVVSLSRQPVIVDSSLEGRHVDLRPFILLGDSPVVLAGGLTRVALRKGSLIVNSSQGGGSTDTWVLSDEA